MNTWPSPEEGRRGAASLPVRLQPGAGTLLSLNAMGASIGAQRKAGKYPHPFKPSLNALGVRLSHGLIEGYPPTIGGEPIGGGPGKEPPMLRLDAAVANEAGESWVCVEVVPDKDGALTRESPRVIVHTREPRSLAMELGRCPLVQILWQKKRPWRAFEIVHFNLRYARVLPPQGAGAVRHVFY